MRYFPYSSFTDPLVFKLLVNIWTPTEVNHISCLSGNNRSTKRDVILEIYSKLDLESVKLRIWSRKRFPFYRIFTEKCASYIFDLIPTLIRVHNTRHSNNAPAIDLRQDYFKSPFFPSTISEWNEAWF